MTRTSLVVWGVAVASYGLTVFIRSSLSVAGLLAQERFGVNAAQLSTFTMVQLLVYAAMQVPGGLAIDRFGPRRLLIAGIAVMTLAQAGFALAWTYPAAIAARVLIGGGDALIFMSVLRLVNSWFPALRVPLFTQATGFLGQLGAMAATVPMTLMLHELGWSATYLIAAGLGGVFVLLLSAFVRDSPDYHHHAGTPISRQHISGTLREVWGRTGTRLGFWVHFASPFSGNAFALLWGYPFLVQAQGLDPLTASTLLTVATAFSMVTGPLIGQFVAYRPFHRSTVVLASLAGQFITWAAVLAWPERAPLWLLVLLVACLGIGGPVSVISFDYARTSNPPSQLGAATGVINQAGFAATVITVLAIGLILDRLTPAGQPFGREAFDWALAAQAVPWLIGTVQVLRYRARSRREFRLRDGDAYERFRRGDLSVDWNLGVHTASVTAAAEDRGPQVTDEPAP